MSHFGGQRSSTPRGGGGYRGGGRQGGRNWDGGGRSSYQGGDGGGGASKGRLTACRNYISTSNCTRGDHCSYSHAIKLHAGIDGSNPMTGQQQQPQQQQHYGSSRAPQSSSTAGNGFSKQQGEEGAVAVSSVALWEDSGGLKIFSGSYDGHWRLWNTASNFSREFEHCMSPSSKVTVVQVCSPYLYVAFEAPIPGIMPLASVGMVHVWNLLTPHQAPLELRLQGVATPYATGRGVSALLGSSDGSTILVGGKDGTIAIWSLQQQQQQQQQGVEATNAAACYHQSKLLQGHAREVTALLSVVTTTTPTTATVLWSCSTDGTIRLWDVAGGTCLCVLSSDTKDSQGRLVGHTSAVTSLRLWESGDFGNYILSAGLDGCIKAWNTEAVLVASSSDSSGTTTGTTITPIGVVCMAISQDTQSQPLLLCGLANGEIAIRALKQTATTQAFALLMTLNARFLNCGHMLGAVRCLEAGPHSTFYSGGDDGKLNVWQVTGDFGLL